MTAGLAAPLTPSTWQLACFGCDSCPAGACRGRRDSRSCCTSGWAGLTAAVDDHRAAAGGGLGEGTRGRWWSTMAAWSCYAAAWPAEIHRCRCRWWGLSGCPRLPVPIAAASPPASFATAPRLYILDFYRRSLPGCIGFYSPPRRVRKR